MHPIAWQFEKKTGQWCVMDWQYSEIYEGLYQAGTPLQRREHRYGRRRTEVYVYELNLEAMTQKNVTTKTVRKIRRVTWKELLACDPGILGATLVFPRCGSSRK